MQPLTQTAPENLACKGLGQRCRSSPVCSDWHGSSLQMQQEQLGLPFYSNSAVHVIGTIHGPSETSQIKT